MWFLFKKNLVDTEYRLLVALQEVGWYLGEMDEGDQKIQTYKISHEYAMYIIGDIISHTSKVMLKSLQARLQQYVNRELPDVQTGFRKGRGTRDQIANICWIMEKEESSRKTSISAVLTMPKTLTVWIRINSGKFWKRWEYQTIWPASWEICMQVRKQQLELDMEQQTGSK